ncbi:MAG: caspase family protein [Ignavibacteriaceae bacterium]|nr:caspase family protein [Ignavibacteriaceae bacterium]
MITLANHAAVIKILLFLVIAGAGGEIHFAQKLVPQSGHAAAVTAVTSFSDKFILSGDRLGNVILWDAETGRQIRNFSGLNREVLKIAVSPDNRHIAALSKEGGVALWVTSSGERIKLVTYKIFNDFAFGSDSTLLLASLSKEVCSIGIDKYDDEIKHLFSYIRLNSADRTVVSSVFSVSDSTWFLLTVTDSDGGAYQLAVSNFLNFSGKQTYDINDGTPGGLGIAQHERYAGLSLKGNIHILDAAGGQILTTIETGGDTIHDFAFSSDGVYLAVQQNDSSAGVWNQITRKSTGMVMVTGKYITSLMISPDRKYIYTGLGTGEILQFDFKTFRQTKAFRSTLRFITAMDFFGNSNSLSVGSLVQGVNILRSDGRVTEISTDEEGFFYTFVSPDEKFIAGINTECVVLWDAETGSEVHRADKPEGMINSAIFSPDGRMIYLAMPDSSLLIFSVAEKKFTKQSGFRGEVFHVSVSPDGKNILLGDEWNRFNLYDAQTYDLKLTLGPHSKFIYSSAWSPDGSSIATTAEDSMVYIWESSGGELIGKIITDHLVVTDVRFSPDGKKLGVSAIGGAVYLYETENWKQLYKFDNTGVYLGFIDFSADSRLIAGTTATGQLRVWNTETGKEEFTFTAFNKTDWAVTLPDGRFDASQEGMKLLHFAKEYDVIPLESFFNENYFPSLAGEALRGTVTPLTESEIQEKFLFKLPPDIKIISPGRNTKLKSGKNLIDIEIVDRGGGIRWVRLFVNDKLTAEQEFDSRGALEGDTLSLVFETELLPDTNKITIVAASLNGIESMPVSEYYFAQGSKPRSKLYIVGIGINDYQNQAYNLKSAKTDIEILSNKFKEGTVGFTAGTTEYLIFNQNANRGEIVSALDSVASLARPQDIFLLLYSGHGVFQNDEKGEGDFYFVLHDMQNMYAGDAASLSKGISASELREHSRKIAANKQLLIIDACQAGGAVEVFAMRGVEEEKAIQSLARSSGMFLLASSARNSAAKELPALGMGIYSYALSEALNCLGDFDKDGVLLVKEMEFYARRKLEEVQKKYNLTPQYPMSWMMYQDFPVSVCK